MKVTVVPAQVTTVEDKVAGSLSFSQLILFAVPVFGGSLLYAVLPPSMGIAIYKIAILGVLTIVSCILAIRIKGRIVLLWLLILLRYGTRPKYYLFNKNTTIQRETYSEVKVVETATSEIIEVASPTLLPKLGLLETTELYALLDNPDSQLRFETTKKGGINVRLTEIQEQSQ